MPQGLQAIFALFVLLPGFLSARVARALSSPSEQTELERIIEALILSFFLYAFYIICFGAALPLEWRMLPTVAGAPQYTVNIHRGRVALLTAFTIVLGLCWGSLRSKDGLLRLLRSWKLTQRTGGESVWNNVFYTLGGTVQVGLADGRVVRGWLSRYSDKAAERSLFLEQAAWITDQGEAVEVPGPGILLTDKAEIHYVMFLNDTVPTPDAEESHS